MDAEELINEYLAEHVGMVNSHKEDWEYHTDPRTRKKLQSWDELYELWDIFSGHDDSTTNTKSPSEPQEIP